MRLKTLRMKLEKPEYAAALQRVLKDRAPQFVSSLLQLCGSSKQLAMCEPGSVIAAAMTAASLDLPIDRNLGFSHIIPYKDKAQFQMGFKGYIQLAMRTGQYAAMNARPINAEAFKGWDNMGEPVIDWSLLDETKPPVGYVFAFKLIGGFTKICFWPKTKVEEHARRYSQSFRSGGETPWKTNFDAMAMKTVIKNELSKWGVLSVQMQRAITEDQGVRKDIDAELEFPDGSPETEPQPPRLLDNGRRGPGRPRKLAPPAEAPPPEPEPQPTQSDEDEDVLP